MFYLHFLLNGTAMRGKYLQSAENEGCLAKYLHLIR